MLCEIPGSSYKPAHLVTLSLAADAFMGFSKSANRRHKISIVLLHLFNYSQYSCTLLCLISTLLLSGNMMSCTFKYVYSVCAQFRRLCESTVAIPYSRGPQDGALALLICAPSVGMKVVQQKSKTCSRAQAVLLHLQVIPKFGCKKNIYMYIKKKK